jgi:hypothetical protein
MPGEILSFRIFGQVIIVLNSIKTTKDLLEGRGDIYSDRPVIPIHEMYVFLLYNSLVVSMIIRMKWEWLVPLARYTEFWRHSRKLLDRGLRSGALAVYRPVLQTKACILLTHVLENPEGLEAHLEQFVVFLSRHQVLLTVFPNFQHVSRGNLGDGIWV